ncbi:MAG: glycosyltransferase family 4 protein [Methylobacter sp.]|nr:glycosyltransferase family 4 protein [Methylobacter sp.]
MIQLSGIFLSALIASTLFTGLLRRYALASSLLDIPNARSSHKMPVPRGGGLAIVIVFLAGLKIIWGMGLLTQAAWWAIFGAGAWVALIGFLDDHNHIPAPWRLLAHGIGAEWVLFWLGGFPNLAFLGHSLYLGWMGHILGMLYLVWMLNLYNFMDGIDGIAGIEAITVCLGGVLLYFLLPETVELWREALLLAMAVGGFLLWNFPPAKIFMGDAGSGFLGIVLGIFSIQAGWLSSQLFWSWLILLGVFIVDATWTLFSRLLRKEKIYEAHRSHAYQYASRRYGSHRAVSLGVGAINMFWLTPIALWVGLGRLDGVLGLLLAYMPLMLLAINFRAGTREME